MTALQLLPDDVVGCESAGLLLGLVAGDSATVFLSRQREQAILVEQSAVLGEAVSGVADLVAGE